MRSLEICVCRLSPFPSFQTSAFAVRAGCCLVLRFCKPAVGSCTLQPKWAVADTSPPGLRLSSMPGPFPYSRPSAYLACPTLPCLSPSSELGIDPPCSVRQDMKEGKCKSVAVSMQSGRGPVVVAYFGAYLRAWGIRFRGSGSRRKLLRANRFVRIKPTVGGKGGARVGGKRGRLGNRAGSRPRSTQTGEYLRECY